MLHAAAMLLGVFAIWLLAAQRFSILDAALGAAVALTCVALSARFGGVSQSFARTLRAVRVVAERSGAVLRGALGAMRAAIAADVTLTPALVRVRTRGRGVGRGAFADMLSATPGMAVVDTDEEGLLVHVLDEDAIDAAELGRLEHLTGAQEHAR